MSNLSVRAFDQAQRRKRYPERKGVAGVAYLQRDLLAAQSGICQISEVLWGANIGREAAEDSPSKNIHDRLSDVGLLLLQFSGALGLDLISILKARIEKEEMSVI